MTYRELYEQGKDTLVKAGIEEAALDARLLLEFICHTDRNDLLVHGDREMDEDTVISYAEAVSERKCRIPLQHITGEQEFMGLTFMVNEHVLIPRQDTEILVEEVLRQLHDGMRILDMCTGSGCILLSLLHYSNHCIGVGVDISEEALGVARENAARLGIPENAENTEGAAASVRWICSDLFEKVQGTFEVIVSNPPYIASNVIPTLMPEVRDYEPMLALDGKSDGLFFYREIIAHSMEHLAGGGMLYFEIGYDQGEAVKKLMEQDGFHQVTVIQDYAGLDRVVYGYK